jgi:hypothetical protein
MIAESRSTVVHILSKDGEKHDCLLPPPDVAAVKQDDPQIVEFKAVLILDMDWVEFVAYG